MKRSRHEDILNIIDNNDIETQEELAEKLRELGYSVTQATVSRDIRQLSLIKILGENGKQRYVAINKAGAVGGSLERVIIETVKSVENAGNLLVIKTLTGMGMAVAVSVDQMEIPDILGTIAGDDVVFCAVKSAEKADELKSMFLIKD